MKNLVLAALLSCGTAVSVFAQTPNTFPASGNVGVGTATPTEKVDVKGNVSISQDNSGVMVDDGSQKRYGLMKYHGRPTGIWRTSNWFEIGRVNSLTNPTSFTTDFLVADNGNVGIGTTNPVARLTVNGDTYLEGNLLLGTDAVGVSTIAGRGNSGAIQIKTHYASGGPANRYLRLGWQDNNAIFAPALSINDNLNVGVGTESPGAWFGGRVFEVADNRPILKLTSLASNDLSTLLFTNSSVDGTNHTGEFHVNYQYNASSPNKSILHFFSYPGGEVMSMHSTGNVGIGTANPGSYRLAVEGTIGAREIVVTNDAWADFVFKPTYKLPSLTEVENYIKANGHLPSVPSEQEIADKGNNLGQTDAILLQKIEELTLYILEQNKQMEVLKKRLEKLENQ